jgi:hypothetical protein
MGNRQPYRDRSNTDASVLTGWYDCDNPKNESPRNTGLVNLPPIRDNMIWYSPQGGGPVYPKRSDGSGIPTYVQSDATYTQPYLTGGGQAIMSGPTYHRSLVDTDSGVAWPEYWENKWFIGDETNPNNRVAVTVNPETVAHAGAPAFAEDLKPIIRPGNGSTQLQSWMDAKFGPDGALYMLDYAGGFFSLHPNQKLIRIVYQGGPATPHPSLATARPVSPAQPRTIGFSAARAGGVAWEWDFGDGKKSTAPHPTHTYKRYGTFQATLKVTYADGTVATATIPVTAGCDAPDARPTVRLLEVDTGVANRVAGGGCTINDLIDDEAQWPNHGAFVNHVDEVVAELTAAHVIDNREARVLNRSAAQSAIGLTNGYETIYDGSAYSLSGWRQAPGGSFQVMPDGSLRSQGGLGMLWYADQQYANFSIRMQFRDVSPEGTRANSGVFVRFPDPRTPLEQRPPGSCGTVGSARSSQAWVAIYCGHEIQLYDGETGEPQKTGSIYNFDSNNLDQAGVTPKGQWNDYEIVVEGQHYTVIRNGVVINEFDNTPGKQSSRQGDPPTDLRQFVSGFIGLQNHSNNDLIEFRNVRVREL